MVFPWWSSGRCIATTATELFSAGHNSAAVDAPALRWFLAEGATGGTFDEFVLIANPNATAANLKVSYLRGGQAPLVKTYTAAAQSRLTHLGGSGSAGTGLRRGFGRWWRA